MSRLTGKKAAFVGEYLGAARFNATAAAKLAGYRATSKHSFESIGSENLTKPTIREAIDQHFKLSRMTAQEVLQELTKLARGDSKQKLRALALLSAHHGLLDGRGSDEEVERRAELLANQKIDQYANEMQVEVDRYNASVVESNRRKTAFMRELQQMFSHSPETAKALQIMYETATEKITIEQAREAAAKFTSRPEPEVEIIVPPQRRLQAAPAERLMAEVAAIEPEITEAERCKHGYFKGECRVIEVGYDCPNYYNRNESRYRYA